MHLVDLAIFYICSLHPAQVVPVVPDQVVQMALAVLVALEDQDQMVLVGLEVLGDMSSTAISMEISMVGKSKLPFIHLFL